jgi:hypothetical protein
MFAPVFTMPTKALSPPCTSADLGAYFDTCSGSSDPTAKACTDWLAAHPLCGSCLESPTTTTAFQSYHGRFYLSLNIAGCIALVRGNDACAAPYNAEIQCRRMSCVDCFGTNGATCTDSDACRARYEVCQASATCQSYDSARVSACAGDAGLNGTPCTQTTEERQVLSNAGASPEEILAAERSWIVRVESVFCGP